MTVGEWLDARDSGVPPALARELREVLGADVGAAAREVPERCIAAAERVIAGLLMEDRTGRGSALSLLAADALVTYAFEAAADEPDLLAERARTAMHILATMR